MKIVKKIRKWLLIITVIGAGGVSGIAWLETMIADAFITTSSDSVKEIVKQEAEDRFFKNCLRQFNNYVLFCVLNRFS